jgi:hypothetical protein
MGTKCKSFALNREHWFKGEKPQMYGDAQPSPNHPHGGWTFYGAGR